MSRKKKKRSHKFAQNLQMMSFLVDDLVKTPFFSRKDFHKKTCPFPFIPFKKITTNLRSVRGFFGEKESLIEN